MSFTAADVQGYAERAFWISSLVLTAFVSFCLLRVLYNISPFHPLAKYPGPLLWKASRLPAAYHMATGDLYKCIALFHEKYGPTVRLAPDELSFTAPEAWPAIYNSRPQLRKSQYHFAPSDRDIPESMITASDSEHMRLRRLAGPAFLNAGIAEIEPTLQHYVDLLCSQLTIASKEGSHDMVEWFLWTLNDVISQLVLDTEFDCLKNRRLHPWPALLLKMLKQSAVLNQFRRYGLEMWMLRPLMVGKVKEQRDGFFHTVNSAIGERLAKEEDESAGKGAKSEKRPDIIGLMLREMKGGDRLSVPEIISNSVLLVGGGAETTSTTLSATLYHLCKTPRVMQKLKEEIRGTFASSEDITLKAVQSLPYLKATIDETLRIFPVASYITPRMTPTGGHVIDGEMVPANTYVSMGQWYMGRSDRWFDNPQEYRPERWFNSELQEASGRQVDEILRPFSLGARNCIGKLLALAEARLVTAKLIWHFDMELDGEHPTWVEDARFYVLWELQPLMVRFKPVR